MADWKSRATPASSTGQETDWKSRALKAEEQAKAPGTFEQALNLLGYPGRVVRTTLATPSEKYSFADVLEQLSTPLNPQKEAPSGKELTEMVELPVIGVNPNFKGPPVSTAPVSLKEAILGKQSEARNPEAQKLLQETLGIGTEVALDPLSYSKTIKTAGEGINKGLEALGYVKSGTKAAAKAVTPTVATVENIGKAIRPEKVQGITGGIREGVGSFIESIGEKFNPKIAKDFQQTQAKLKKFGIPEELLPDSALVEKESDMNRLYRTIAEGPGGEDLRIKHDQFLDTVIDKTNNYVDKLSNGKMLNLKDNAQKGEALIKAFEDAREAIKNKIDWDRGMIYRNIPVEQRPIFSRVDVKNTANQLQGVEKSFNKAITAIDPRVREQAINAKDLFDNTIMNAVMSGDVESIHNTLQYIGEQANGPLSRNLNPEIKNILNQAYKIIGENYDNMIRKQFGKDIFNRVQENNKLWSQWYEAGDDFGRVLSNEISPEKVYTRVIQNGNSQDLKKLSEFLSKNNADSAAQLKGLIADDILRPDVNKEFSFRMASNKLTSPAHHAKYRTVLNPNEMKDLEDLLSLGDRAGDYRLNTSNTAVSMQYGELAGALKKNAINRGMYTANLERLKNPNFIPPTTPQAVPQTPGLSQLIQQTPQVLPQNKQVLDPNLLKFLSTLGAVDRSQQQRK